MRQRSIWWPAGAACLIGVLLLAFGLGGCGGPSLATDRPFNALARSAQLALVHDGWIVGIEKRGAKRVGKDGRRDERRFRELPGCGDPAVGRLNLEYRQATGHPETLLVTHIASFFSRGGVADGHRDVRFDYNPYEPNGTGSPRPKKVKLSYERGFEELGLLRERLRERLADAEPAYTHVLVMSMGWNNDQHESIRRFNVIVENLKGSARGAGARFRPLVIGLTWPSVWSGNAGTAPARLAGHLFSYSNKANDADEAGYTIANWLLHRTVAGAVAEVEQKPRVVVIGHSFGARLLSRAVYSREHLHPDYPPGRAVDLFFGLQGAFSVTRFAPGGTEGGPYADVPDTPTRVVLVSSTHDEANPWAFWSPHAGGVFGLRAARNRPQVFETITWPPGQPPAAFPTGDRVLMINGSRIVRHHNDLLDAEMADLMWSYFELLNTR